MPEPDAYVGATKLWRQQTIKDWAARRPRKGKALMIAETNSSTQIAHGTGTLFTHWPVSVVVRGKYFPL